MWPDRVSNPGPLTYESGALPIALRGPAHDVRLHRFSTEHMYMYILLCQSKRFRFKNALIWQIVLFIYFIYLFIYYYYYFLSFFRWDAVDISRVLRF